VAVVELPENPYLSQMKTLAYSDLSKLMDEWNQLQLQRMKLDQQVADVVTTQSNLINKLAL
jgi:hypothetical protein